MSFAARVALAVVLLVGVAQGEMGRAAEGPSPTRRWNLVLIVADDLGLQLGCYGDKQARTPHLDALAAAGTRFARAYCTTASCSASRSVILSGLHTHATGHYGHAHATHHFSSYDTLRTLPVLLAEQGYRTCSIGKYHLAPEAVYHFETYANDGIQGARNAVRMADNAKTWIAQADERPFFLYFCSTDPHRAGGAGDFANGATYPGVEPVKFDPTKLEIPPWLPDRPEVRREWAEFYEATNRLDQGVGRLMEVLKETGHDQDTIVLFISDNGPPFPNAKTTQYEPGIRLPLLVRVPGAKAGQVSDALVSWLDLTPTLLDWAGVREIRGRLQPVEVGSAAKKPAAGAKPPEYRFQGRSFAALFGGGEYTPAEAVFGSHQFHEVTMYYPMRTLVERRYKLVFNIAHPLEYPFASDLYESLTWQGVLKRNDALFGNRPTSKYLHRPRWELYDLESDPHELRNLADDPAHQERLTAMQSRLKAWQRETKDPWELKHERE